MKDTWAHGTFATLEIAICVCECRKLNHRNPRIRTAILVLGGRSGVKVSGPVAHTLWIWSGGHGVPSGTSPAQESSIFVFECRGLDHSNRVLQADISNIANSLKPFKIHFSKSLILMGISKRSEKALSREG
jgi:hypothetical protein